MACPTQMEYVVYCPKCKSYLRNEVAKVDEGYCAKCDKEIGPKFLSKGHGRFIVFRLREQIQNYLENDDFKSIMRVFAFMNHGKCKGPIHHKIQGTSDFDLNMGLDSGDLSSDGSISIYPLGFFLNNLPLNLQHRCVQCLKILKAKRFNTIPKNLNE